MAERSTYGTGLYGVDFYSYDPFVYFGASSSVVVVGQPVSFGLHANFSADALLRCSINAPALTIAKNITTDAVLAKVSLNDAVLGRLISYNAADKFTTSIIASMLRVQSLQAASMPLGLGVAAGLQLFKNMMAAGVVQYSPNTPKLDVLRGLSTNPTSVKPLIDVSELLRYRGFYANDAVRSSIKASFDVHAVRYFTAYDDIFTTVNATLGRLRPFAANSVKLNCSAKMASLYAGSFWLDDRPENSDWSAIDIISTIWVDDTPTEGGWR